ncbi:MAG: alpha/beta hydrolase [Candidatus Aminicenantes bacterium]|nr:alpha/beta hydrolase [Candidatus Aminicenantes bacterium]
MLNEEKLLKSLEGISESEFQRYMGFIRNHSIKQLQRDGFKISYYSCGSGEKAILTFAGGWGPPEIAYDMILAFEEKNRVVVIDVSPFDNPEDMCRGVDQILETENIDRVVLSGQSMSGIIAQSYFKRNSDRVIGLVLTNTIAPREERCKKWVLVLLRVIPLSLLKYFAKKQLRRLGKLEKEIPVDIRERRRFVAALMSTIMDQYFTKENTMNLLKSAYAFNEKDGYTRSDFEGWQGRALIITSEDDPYYGDTEILMQSIPNAELFKFPTGYKHTAPQIHRDEFHSLIQRFIDGL